MYRKCPKCGGNGIERIAREWWMYFIPKSRLFRCYLCNHHIMESLWHTHRLGPQQPAESSDDLHVSAHGVKGGSSKQKSRSLMPYLVAIGMLTVAIAFALISRNSHRYDKALLGSIRAIPIKSLPDDSFHPTNPNPVTHEVSAATQIEALRLEWEKKKANEEERLANDKETIKEAARLIAERQQKFEAQRLEWEKNRANEEERLANENPISAPNNQQLRIKEKENLSIGYMTYRVDRSMFSPTLNNVSGPDGVFLVVLLTIRNDGDLARRPPSFRLIDEKGVEYETTNKGQTQKIVLNTSESVMPHASKIGVLIFDVPHPNGKHYLLKVADGHDESDDAFVELSPGERST